MTQPLDGEPGPGGSRLPLREWLGSRPFYPWLVVGLLWFCGFFNYADRQAVFSVFPLLKAEYHLSRSELGWLGSAFMLVYALASPGTGYLVDRFSRRLLIVGGLSVWSVICAATALSKSFAQLIFFRAAEGLGESFYFPASMSCLADYHGRGTRSRALWNSPDQRVPGHGRWSGAFGISGQASRMAIAVLAARIPGDRVCRFPVGKSARTGKRSNA